MISVGNGLDEVKIEQLSSTCDDHNNDCDNDDY